MDFNCFFILWFNFLIFFEKKINPANFLGRIDKQENKMNTKMITFLLGLLLIGGCLSAEDKKELAEERRREQQYGSRSMAWIMAQDFVEARLKSPGSASYGDWLEQNYSDNVTDLGEGLYHTRGWVDSQNGFGAMLRSNFLCTLQYNGNDRWTCTWLVIGGRTFVKDDEYENENASKYSYENASKYSYDEPTETQNWAEEYLKNRKPPTYTYTTNNDGPHSKAFLGNAKEHTDEHPSKEFLGKVEDNPFEHTVGYASEESPERKEEKRLAALPIVRLRELKEKEKDLAIIKKKKESEAKKKKEVRTNKFKNDLENGVIKTEKKIETKSGTIHFTPSPKK